MTTALSETNTANDVTEIKNQKRRPKMWNPCAKRAHHQTAIKDSFFSHILSSVSPQKQSHWACLVLGFFRPLCLLIVIMSTSSRGAQRQWQSGRKTPLLAIWGGGRDLKGVTKRKQQQIICQVPKTTRGKETTTSSLQITGQAIYLVTVCLFQLFEGLSCFWGDFKNVLFILFYFCPNDSFFFLSFFLLADSVIWLASELCV